MNQGTIISLGSVNADFQVRVPHRPAISETLLAHDFIQLSGGKAANVAYLARRLGINATLLAHVGDDTLREQALAPLREIGVDLSHVRVVGGSATGVSMITVPPDGKKGIVLAGNANHKWNEGDAAEVRKAIEDAPPGSLLVVDYEVPPVVAKQAVNTAYERNIPVVLDPSPADRVEQRLFPKVAYLVPNAGEAEGLTDISIDSAEAAAKAGRLLMERGVEYACMKLKDGGCVLVSREAVVHVPPVPVEVVDTTGAGDAFAGALAVAVMEGRSSRDAACFATAASHYCVTRYGSQPAYPTRGEMDDLFRRLAERAYDLDV
jgi:ribokinase